MRTKTEGRQAGDGGATSRAISMIGTTTLLLLAPLAAPVAALAADGDAGPAPTDYWVLGGGGAALVALCVYAAISFMKTDRRFEREEQESGRRKGSAAKAAAPAPGRVTSPRPGANAAAPPRLPVPSAAPPVPGSSQRR
jgi:hypothetical protein